jgi:RNA polymerase-binding transcription factor DksA
MDATKATALLTREEIRIRGLLTDLESGGEVSRTGSVEHLEAPQDRSLDGGSELAERSLQLGMLEQLQGELHDLARARADLAAGDYGKCLTCGVMISDERLNAMPTTQRCIKHA